MNESARYLSKLTTPFEFELHLRATMRNSLVTVLLCATMISAASSPGVRADLITLGTSKDASIFSESSNNNGAGSLYAGVAGNIVGTRRALLGFNIAGSIPAGSTINSVTLTITQTRHGPSAIAESLELRPLLETWGEGVGTAKGVGSAPTAGAVTWNFRQFGSNAWSTSGGSYGPASGLALFGLSNFTATTFSSQPGLVADVQNWLNNPGTSYGWILKYVNETTEFGAREIASKENAVAAWRPALTISYTAIPEPNSFALLGAAAIAMTRFRLRRRKLGCP